MKITEELNEKYPKTWVKFKKETKAHIYLVPMGMADNFGNDVSIFVNGLIFNIQLWTMKQGVAVIPKIKGAVDAEDYIINLYKGLKQAWGVLEKK